MKDTASTLVWEMVSLNEENRYELQNCTDFTILTIKSVRKRLESFLWRKTWEKLPLDIQQTTPLSQCKANIKKWNP